MKKSIIILALCCFSGCSTPIRQMLSPCVRITKPGSDMVGSGVVVHKRSMGRQSAVIVLTNYHIAAAIGRRPFVRFYRYDRRGVITESINLEGRIAAHDSATDTALIVVKIPPGWGIPASIIKKSDTTVGDRLLSVSCPGGVPPIMHEGIMSGFYRASVISIRMGIYTGGLCKGSSGGGIYNEKGDLVGIVSRIPHIKTVDGHVAATNHHTVLFVPITKEMLVNLSGVSI